MYTTYIRMVCNFGPKYMYPTDSGFIQLYTLIMYTPLHDDYVIYNIDMLSKYINNHPKAYIGVWDDTGVKSSNITYSDNREYNHEIHLVNKQFNMTGVRL